MPRPMRLANSDALGFLATVLLCSVVCVALWGCRTTRTVVPDQSTPEAAMRSYYQAANVADRQMMSTVLAPDYEANKQLLAGFEAFSSHGARIRFSDIEISVLTESETTARVRTNYTLAVLSTDQTQSEYASSEFWGLVKQEGKWYLVADGAAEEPSWTPMAEPRSW